MLRLAMVGVVLASTVAGCAGTPRTALRYAVDDLQCPEAEVRWVSEDVFEATGCDARVLYYCPNRSACERHGLDEVIARGERDDTHVLTARQDGADPERDAPAADGPGSDRDRTDDPNERPEAAVPGEPTVRDSAAPEDGAHIDPPRP